MSTLLAYIRADATLDTPVIPGTWERQIESNRWSTIYPLGRVDGRCFFARLIVRGSPTTRAVFVCVGPAAMLTRLATAIASDALSWTQTWANLPALRADGGTVATTIKAAWVDERPHALSGLPGSIVDGGPVGTLVALYGRMAGSEAEDGES